MKKNVWISLLVAMLFSMATIVTGCGDYVSENDDTSSLATPTETSNLSSDTMLASISSDIKPVDFPDKSDLKFSDLKGVEFWFGSGAGAWRTTLEIQPDGTFKGHFRDDDVNIADECYFSGKFSPLKKTGSYEYSMKCESLKQEGTIGEKKIIDGITVTTSTPYGFDNAGEFRLYLPGKKASDLSEEYLSWTNGTVSDDILPSYGLYNVGGKQGFIVWPK